MNNEISCKNNYNMSYFQCQNSSTNFPSARQLGSSDLVSLVPQFVNSGRFDVARHKNMNYLGVRNDNMPADLALSYINVFPAASMQGGVSDWN